MQFLSYNVCSVMLSPKVYVYSGLKIKQTYRSDHAPSSHLQEVENFGKLLHLFSPEKWPWSLTGGGCLQARASSCKALTGKIVVCFWCVKTYKRWTHMAVWLSVCLPRTLPLSLFDSLASLCTKGKLLPAIGVFDWSHDALIICLIS